MRINLLNSIWRKSKLAVDAREAIVDLLDNHFDVLALSRKQLADIAGVNVGQLSNWLRAGGPLSPQKEGRVAQVMLERVEAALRNEPPPGNSATLFARAEVLRSYGPRRRQLAAQPEAALKGRPISPDNTYYIKRAADAELEKRLNNDLTQLAIIGGPKTGRSSLLLASQAILEPKCTVLFVDLAEYAHEAQPALSVEESQAKFCGWLADRCEAQLSGSFRGTFTCRDDAVPWVLHNVLPNSQGGRCVLLLDHLERLPHSEGEPYTSREFDILDRILLAWLNERVDQPALTRLGFVLAFDLEWCGLPRDKTGAHVSSVAGSRLDRLYIKNMSEHEVGRLLQVRGAAPSEIPQLRESAWTRCGGQAYLTQSFASEFVDPQTGGKNQVEESIKVIGSAVRDQWPALFLKLVAKEIDVILKLGEEQNGAARKALEATGLCVRADPEKGGAPGHHPMRAANPNHLEIFKREIRR